VIVCLNHPSWWDPLFALTLANATFKGRQHFAPIDAKALQRYRFFERLGFFGIEANSLKGAARFVQTGRSILRDSRSVLWITAEGAFTDVRSQPLKLKTGIGHLMHGLDRAVVIPLALEYEFWEERKPEALACWGRVISVIEGSRRRPAEWTEAVAFELQAAKDRLANLAIGREKKGFDVLLAGRSGVSFTYDAWRWLRAKVQGRSFLHQHGSERI
jgi:1-acyl-sn-glycerol-3-phosphate acyltransferase